MERVHVVPRETQGSWVSLSADPRGVLYASDQYGPMYRIELSTQRGGACNVREVKPPIGGALGPDLTAVAGRFSTRDLLESIVDPSREISDQYGTIVLTERDGTKLNGRICNHGEGVVQVLENLFDPSAVTKVKERDVLSIEPSKISLMPTGLLDVLQADEILDLLAFLKSGLHNP